MTAHSAPSGQARTFLLVAAVVVVVESLAYLALSVLDVLDAPADERGVHYGAAALIVAYGLGQLVAMRLLLRGSAGARAPLVVTQVLQVLVATSLRDQPNLALGIGAAAAVVLGCLLAPPVTRSLTRVSD